MKFKKNLRFQTIGLFILLAISDLSLAMSINKRKEGQILAEKVRLMPCWMPRVEGFSYEPGCNEEEIKASKPSENKIVPNSRPKFDFSKFEFRKPAGSYVRGNWANSAQPRTTTFSSQIQPLRTISHPTVADKVDDISMESMELDSGHPPITADSKLPCWHPQVEGFAYEEGCGKGDEIIKPTNEEKPKPTTRKPKKRLRRHPTVADKVDDISMESMELDSGHPPLIADSKLPCWHPPVKGFSYVEGCGKLDEVIKPVNEEKPKSDNRKPKKSETKTRFRVLPRHLRPKKPAQSAKGVENEVIKPNNQEKPKPANRKLKKLATKKSNKGNEIKPRNEEKPKFIKRKVKKLAPKKSFRGKPRRSHPQKLKKGKSGAGTRKKFRRGRKSLKKRYQKSRQ